jgi:hypothetical protein
VSRIFSPFIDDGNFANVIEQHGSPTHASPVGSATGWSPETYKDPCLDHISPAQPARISRARTSTPHTMFSKVIISAFALAATVSALPGYGESSSPSQCTTSTPQCCQNVQNSNDVGSVVTGLIKGLLGLDLSGLNVPIGTGCTPIDILGGVNWYVCWTTDK